MREILTLDALLTCYTREAVVSVLNELLGDNATEIQRTIALNTVMGVRQSFGCGDPIPPKQAYGLAIEQLVRRNKNERAGDGN